MEETATNILYWGAEISMLRCIQVTGSRAWVVSLSVSRLICEFKAWDPGGKGLDPVSSITPISYLGEMPLHLRFLKDRPETTVSAYVIELFQPHCL